MPTMLVRLGTSIEAHCNASFWGAAICCGACDAALLPIARAITAAIRELSVPFWAILAKAA